tara:strand:- start:410 stop:640 length:231 start_codon:yes stop_codon:yes gene_type:complete
MYKRGAISAISASLLTVITYRANGVSPKVLSQGNALHRQCTFPLIDTRLLLHTLGMASIQVGSYDKEAQPCLHFHL